MQVLVKLFGCFRAFFPPGTGPPSFLMDLEEGAMVRDILARLRIPEREPREIICNHRLGLPEQVLEDGDTVAIFPPLAGGG